MRSPFEFIDKIGEGGFGEVYLAIDKEINEVCAVKKIKKHLSENSEFYNNTKQEALIWLSMEKHPNVVTIKKVDFFNGCFYFSLEYVAHDDFNRNTLQDHMQDLDWIKLLKFAIDICEGMNHIISNGVVAHKDLKPTNLLIDSSGILKITDFGLAISVETAAKFNLKDVSGTPVYMPPEQFLSPTKLTQRSDIYSFGIILYQMLFRGKLPFPLGKQSYSLQDFYNIHCQYKIPHFKSSLYTVIKKCLEKDLRDRYNSFEEISKELKSIFKNTANKDYTSPKQEELQVYEHINFSKSYALLNSLDKAFFHINKAISLAPYYLPALNNKASLFAQAGQLKEAVELWSELTKSAPQLGLPFYNIGNYFMKENKIKKSIWYFKQAIEKEPNYYPAYVNAAICSEILKDYDEAFAFYKKALVLAPDDAQIYYNIGLILFNLKNYSQALINFEKTVDLNPAHISAINYIGVCYQGLRDHHQAIKYFNAALNIDPTYKYAIQNKELSLKYFNDINSHSIFIDK